METTLYKNFDKINIFNPLINNFDESDNLAKSFAIYLKISKGSFLLDKTVGSNFINQLRSLSYKNFDSDLFYLIEEAASNFQLINIKNVESFINRDKSSLLLDITITINHDTYLISTEVFI